VAAGCEIYHPDVRCGGVHGQIDLALLASALDCVFARLQFSIAQELGAGAVDQEVQGAISASMRDLNGQRLLPLA